MDFSLPIASALIGVVVLLLGRKIFWICVAAIGFAAGVEVAPHLVSQPSPLLQLSLALVLGLIGALLALFQQKLAIGIAGFALGGRLAVGLATAFLVDSANSYWITFIIGGVIGAILLLTLFDWAIILLSAFLGAHLIVSAFALPQTGATILFLALAIIGIIVQSAILRRRGAAAD
jgi:hypothetical protein